MKSLKKKFGKFAVSSEKMAQLKGGANYQELYQQCMSVCVPTPSQGECRSYCKKWAMENEEQY